MKIRLATLILAIVPLIVLAGCQGLLYTTPTATSQPSLTASSPSGALTASQITSAISAGVQGVFTTLAQNAPTTQAAANDQQIAAIAGSVNSLSNTFQGYLQSQQSTQQAATQQSNQQLTALGQTVSALTAASQALATAQPGTPWGTIAGVVGALGAVLLGTNYQNKSTAAATVAAVTTSHQTTMQTVTNVLQQVATALAVKPAATSPPA